MLIRTVLARFSAPLAAAILYLAVHCGASADETAAPVIAVILPQLAKGLEIPSDAVWRGALAAERKLGDEHTPKLRLYPATDQPEDTLAAYKQAVADGAVSVIGPLTRSGISAIASSGKLTIPVLALNVAEDSQIHPNLYEFGLNIELDARQLARQMFADEKRNPVVIFADSPLARRIRDAFVAEWAVVAGTEPAVESLGTGRDAFSRLRDMVRARNADAVFLAATDKHARMIRPYLGQDAKVYATAQVWNGHFGPIGSNLDLIGVKFVDMPWMLDPYNPDNLAFDRSATPISADMDRLYALGIDAYRLTLLMRVSSPDASIELQGVTGLLKLSDNHTFSRELMPGEIGQPPATPAPAAPQPPAPDAPNLPAAPVTETPPGQNPQ